MWLTAAVVLLVPGATPRIATAQDVGSTGSGAPLTIIAPAAPGGGWDQLAREMEREIERQRLATVQVENIPGAAGTIGLAQMISARRGDPRTLMVNGLVMVGAILWNDSPVSLAQVTPIARLTGEAEVIAVPATSPHHDMPGLVRALRQNPEGVSWAGGSAGGTDHLLAGLIVSAAGLDPRRTNYIAFSGGGEAAAALIGGQVTAGISGYSEFAQYIESGRLRAIAVSSARRQPGRDVATLLEQGVDVQFENWRAVVAPPGLDAAARQRLTTLVDRMAHSDTWRETASGLGWTDSYLAGEAFERFLDSERVRIARIVSRLKGAGPEAAAARAGEWVFPTVVMAGSLAAGLLLVVRAARERGRVPGLAPAVERGPAPAAPNAPTEATEPSPPAARGAVIRVAAGLAAFVLLLDPIGFVAAGTFLYIATASGFGSRRWLRDGAIGALFCAAVYVAFTRGLGVPLP